MLRRSQHYEATLKYYREGMKNGPELVAEARAAGYQPLVAETLALMGTIYLKTNDSPAAEQALVESYLAADASRHDEVRAEDATNLVWVVGYEQGGDVEADRWAKVADAVLHRLGGHERLQAWLLNNLAAVYEARGDREAALRMDQRSLALKTRVLGGDDPDVGISEGNMAVALNFKTAADSFLGCGL